MMDEVDQLVAAWRRERPDLDTEPMQVCSRISRLAQLLDAARARAYSAQVLQVWEFDVLAVLRRAGEPYRLTPGQLINQTHVTSGTMTNRVVRLAERGLVTRTANPADGSAVRQVALADNAVRAVPAATAHQPSNMLGAMPTGKSEPGTSSSIVSFLPASGSSATISWTNTGAADGTIILVKSGGAVDANPAD